MATSVQTTQRKRRYTEDDLKHLPRDGYKLRELFAGVVIIPIARAEFTIAPLLQVPPASRGEPRTGSVPPASRGNLKEGVFNRACFCKLCPRDWYYLTSTLTGIAIPAPPR
jgi:hypothetical protein